MRKMINLNDHYIDTNKVSFIGRADSIVKAHLGSHTFYFNVIVDGETIKVEADKKPDIIKLRNELIQDCGASVPQEQIGLLPS